MINAGDAKQTAMPIGRKFKSLFVTLLLFSVIHISSMVAISKQANAYVCGCHISDCIKAQVFVIRQHNELVSHTQSEFDSDLQAFQNWLVNDLFNGEVVPATAAMVTQMSAVAMQYTQIIGTFIDAQTQLETQRVLRQLQYEAHRDYAPSETFCYFGSNVKSMASTENKGRYNALALSRISIDRQMGTVSASGGTGFSGDYKSRWNQFVDTYCDPLDNNFQDLTGGSSSLLGVPTGKRTGLMLACEHIGTTGSTSYGAEDKNRYNRDINYTRLIEKPRTLDVDYTDGTLNSAIPPASSLYSGSIHQPGDEEDVIALAKNLYGHKVLSRKLTRRALKQDDAKKMYLTLRSVAAKRNVAQASYNAIVALKSAGTTHESTGDVDKVGTTVTLDNHQTRRYMAAIINQLLPANPESSAANIFSLIGYSPSYFSQLEILAKRIYQDPGFYANLYDTPANVKRKKVAMKAVELMVDRAIYESQIRREMSISVLLASKLRAAHRSANRYLAVVKGQSN